MKYVITFGQKYDHETHPTLVEIDGNAFVTVEADDEQQARQKVIERIGVQWAFIYEYDEFIPQIQWYDLWDATRYFDALVADPQGP